MPGAYSANGTYRFGKSDASTRIHPAMHGGETMDWSEPLFGWQASASVSPDMEDGLVTLMLFDGYRNADGTEKRMGTVVYMTQTQAQALRSMLDGAVRRLDRMEQEQARARTEKKEKEKEKKEAREE